jgi:hypothetical protein
MPEDVETLPRTIVRTSVAVQPQESRSEKIVLGFHLLELLVQGIWLGRQRPPSDLCGSPRFVRQPDPACDPEKGVLHCSSFCLQSQGRRITFGRPASQGVPVMENR